MLSKAIQSGLELLARSSEAMIEAHKERVLWRHQLIGDPNPLAQNAAGIDPHGLPWRTVDFAPWASPQGVDQRGLKTFFLYGGVPTTGDIIALLAGRPETEPEALVAPRVAYFSVKSVDTRRTPSGEVVYCKVKAAADFSGQYGEYGLHPHLLSERPPGRTP